MKNRFNLANFYIDTLSTAVTLTYATSWETTIPLNTTPSVTDGKEFFIIFNPLDSVTRQVLRVFRTWSTIKCYNKYITNNATFSAWAQVQINDVAELFNVLYENTDDFWLAKVLSWLNLNVNWWLIRYNNTDVSISDITLALPNATPNIYIVFDYSDWTLKYVTTLSWFVWIVLAECATSWWAITGLTDKRRENLGVIYNTSIYFDIVSWELVLKDNSISTAKIQDSAVVTDKIANLNVTEWKIANWAVSANKIWSNAVTTDKIMNNNVTIQKLEWVSWTPAISQYYGTDVLWNLWFHNTTGSVGAVDIIEEVPAGTIDGVNPIFTLSQSPSDAEAVWIYINWAIQYKTTHYTIVDKTITFITPPSIGVTIVAKYIHSIGIVCANPTTTTWDIMYRDSWGIFTRLWIGATGYVLKVVWWLPARWPETGWGWGAIDWWDSASLYGGTTSIDWWDSTY